MPDDKNPRWLEYVALDDLKPDPRNPKDHDIDELRASMGRFGYTEPIMDDLRTGLLVAGHGRREILIADRDEGREPPEGVTIVNGVWFVPVNKGWASKDDDEAGAYLIASNRLTMLGGWKPDPLVSLLEVVARTPLGLQGIGYDQPGLDDLIASLRPPSLDDLAAQHGEPNAEAMWPVLRFKIPPPMRDRYLKLVEGREGGDHDLFGYLLSLAERSPMAPEVVG